MLPFLANTLIIPLMVRLTFAYLPSIFIREVLWYSKLYVENIEKTISNINWNKASKNLYIDGKVELF